MVCYFSAGSWEEWRDDAKRFAEGDLGKGLDGWPGERWLDVRSEGVRGVMRERVSLAGEKGCDGVDPDNVDGYVSFFSFFVSCLLCLFWRRCGKCRCRCVCMMCSKLIVFLAKR